MNKSNAQGIATRKRNEQVRRERKRQEMEEVKAQADALRRSGTAKRPRQGSAWRPLKCLKI